jgi:endoglucanase
MIFLDGNRYSTDFSPFDPAEVYPNVVYAAHDYKSPGLAEGGPYPGETRGQWFDRDVVERGFLKRTEFMRASGTPIWIGEFGVLFTGDGATDAQRYQLLQDQLDLYRDHGASWSMWGYKDVGDEGVVSAAPDSPWLQRIAPVIEKKARLGVDRWGGRDTHIRHVMEPIERLFAEEYPDFDPFPFGAQPWAAQLVRHILLAEPMVQDFGRCFVGIDDDATLHELADSFRWDRCVRRGQLEEVLRKAAQGI